MAEKKILVISDDHGNVGTILQVIEKESPIDILVHCGDSQEDLYSFLDDGSFTLIAVRGNMDYYPYSELMVLDVGKCTLMACHGHKLGVKYTNENLILSAMEHKADIVLFGHTHMSEEFFHGRTLFFNPGSIAYPKSGGKGTYGIIYMDEEGGHYRTKIKTMDQE